MAIDDLGLDPASKTKQEAEASQRAKLSEQLRLQLLRHLQKSDPERSSISDDDYRAVSERLHLALPTIYQYMKSDRPKLPGRKFVVALCDYCQVDAGTRAELLRNYEAAKEDEEIRRSGTTSMPLSCDELRYRKVAVLHFGWDEIALGVATIEPKGGDYVLRLAYRVVGDLCNTAPDEMVSAFDDNLEALASAMSEELQGVDVLSVVAIGPLRDYRIVQPSHPMYREIGTSQVYAFAYSKPRLLPVPERLELRHDTDVEVITETTFIKMMASSPEVGSLHRPVASCDDTPQPFDGKKRRTPPTPSRLYTREMLMRSPTDSESKRGPVVFVHIGRGIGVGVSIEGRPLYGDGRHTEVGHQCVPLYPTEIEGIRQARSELDPALTEAAIEAEVIKRVSACDRHLCLDGIASQRGLLKFLRKEQLANDVLSDLSENEWAKVIGREAFYVSYLVANCISFFMPYRVVLGDGLIDMFRSAGKNNRGEDRFGQFDAALRAEIRQRDGGFWEALHSESDLLSLDKILEYSQLERPTRQLAGAAYAAAFGFDDCLVRPREGT